MVNVSSLGWLLHTRLAGVSHSPPYRSRPHFAGVDILLLLRIGSVCACECVVSYMYRYVWLCVWARYNHAVDRRAYHFYVYHTIYWIGPVLFCARFHVQFTSRRIHRYIRTVYSYEKLCNEVMTSRRTNESQCTNWAKYKRIGPMSRTRASLLRCCCPTIFGWWQKWNRRIESIFFVSFAIANFL